MTLIGAGTVVLDGRVCKPGWLETSGGQILACGPGAPPRSADHGFADSVVVPGFVDMHVHGGGGASYTDGVSADITRAAAFHRGHGTTTTLASVVDRVADRASRASGCARRDDSAGYGRRHPSGGPMAQLAHAAVRTMPRSCAIQSPPRSTPCSPPRTAPSGW